ncbi:phage integrase SAM-like domain-containing protein [Marivirga sp.]|uniref:phage integrase SAM-like domain-containing protein n=1 Tax=Marivirga sp. TaxID=2018662 RepID=UPI002D80D623|nr:phage integrase SAM-like domain-containing protein [Marivirga sp.]HET8860926.1 phage integrase SAM-like domain-containing protein [Marivirga sp.]
MPAFKAIIRENKANKNGECVIYIRYGHFQKSVDFSTGTKILPEHWNKKKQRVNSTGGIKKTKRNEELVYNSKKSDNSVNSIIDTMISNLKKIVHDLVQKNIEPEIHLVKEQYLNDKEPKAKTVQEDRVVELFQTFINNSNKSKRTILNYGTALYHLKAFEEYTNQTLTLEMIDMQFLDDFFRFLHVEIEKSDKTKGLAINTVGSTIKNLKVFLTYLESRGYDNLTIIPKIKVPKEETPIYFLTEDEIEQLHNCEFETDRLNRVRDLFIFNCYAGLRFSDLSRLSKDHIIDDVIELRAFKNQKDIYNPLTPVSTAILKKYNYELPKLSAQKYNKFIKEACAIAKINQKVEKTTTVLGNKKTEWVPKHDIVSSHIAIKTFITLCEKKGIPPKDVATMTGKTVKVILKHYSGTDKPSIKQRALAAFQ